MRPKNLRVPGNVPTKLGTGVIEMERNGKRIDKVMQKVIDRKRFVQKVFGP